MKLGGLFSGIGGFELAWQRLGHDVAWMCEIDPNARAVLSARFPGVPIYEDVQEIDPEQVEAVDVLTGGSPCQGFSTAGRRQGLLHGESRLFADYARILDGLGQRGLKWALWENVPGVLSIRNDDGQRTFPHVIGALVGSTDAVRLPAKAKWNVGMAAEARRAVAWRILDSRYFGVAQRRRRVFACVHIGDDAVDRAGRALLAKSEGVPWHLESGEPAWKEPASTVGGSVEDPRIASTVSVKWHKGTGGPSGSETGNLVADVPVAFDWQMGHTGNTSPSAEEIPALSATKTPALLTGDRIGYSVRRLTPVECERLQGFPDGWTEPAGSDTSRYKALGNAVTVNTVEWVLRRITEA